MSQTSAGGGVSTEPLFEAGHTVGRRHVLDFLNWAKESDDWMASDPKPPPPDKGVLALPPVQRTAVWTPKQVVDLWDSALRGLPLGTLFLVRRPSGRRARALGADAPNREVGDGWDLLDGQQRTRSLLLGVRGPELKEDVQDKRCLWIDLAGKPQSHCFSLRLTSESQPFGYEAGTGRKLPVEDRRKARNSIEPEPDKNPIKKDGRLAFNHELFSGLMQGELTPSRTPKGWKPEWPPLPAHAVNSTAVFPLHILLQAWQRGNTPEEQLRILRETAPDSEQTTIAKLHTAFENLRNAEFAMVKVEVANDDNLLLLFDRIGAAGSPLTGDERLFSIYKRYEPSVHDAVNEIYKNVGRVLPPTKIAASAIRIANARAHQEPGQGNSLPEVRAFAKEMGGSADPKRTRSIKSELGELLLDQHAKGSLAEAFRVLFDVLRYQGATDIGLPRVMFTGLSPNLLQVLLLWILQAKSDSAIIQNCRPDIIRFVMFWRLCVLNEDKASARCFEAIKKTPTAVTMKALYELLVEDRDSAIAVQLASPLVMRACLVRSKGSHRWLSNDERFDPKGAGPVGHVELARRWWKSGEASLLWLQRAYLERSFRDFDPASGRDDDTPYDLDHMIPQSDWSGNWTKFSNKLSREAGLEGPDLDRMHTSRWVVGDALGNKWLVDFSTNRGWGKAPFGEKIEKLVDEVDRQSASELSYEDLAFDPAAAHVWLRASDPDGKWSKDRLISFEQAVEARTAWLYERFYTDLNFPEFERDCSASVSPSADKWPSLAPGDEHELEPAE